MNKYENGKIYKIDSLDYSECYIGSTCESLSQRLARHRKDYRRWKAGKRDIVSVFNIFDKVGIDNCKIELIENCPVGNKEELSRKEGEHIRLNDCVNKIIAGRTRKERYEDNKEKELQQCKEYRDTHKEQIKQYHKEYREKNKEYLTKHTLCECGGTYVPHHRTRHFRTVRHQNYLKQEEK